jgi:glycosyltransferase involved in cell wall biosynthesis
MVLTSFYPIRGGAENQARLQGAELVRRGHNVTVVTWRRDHRLPVREIVDGVTVHRVPAFRRRRLGPPISAALMVAALARRIVTSDVVVAHQVNAPAHLGAVIAWAARKPMIAKVAVSPEMPGTELNQLRSPGLGGLARRAAIRFLAGHVVAVAMTGDIEAGLRHLGFRRIVRIPNGVCDAGIPDRSRLRAELLPPLGVPTRAKLVVASGRLTWQKGFDRLLRAWALGSQGGEDRFAVLMGSGQDRERLQSMARELGISATIRFVSAHPRQAREYLAAADAVVIPSRYEGMSNVLLEAMAAAVPIVSTPVSGSVDLIRDGYNGRIVPHEDPSALISAIDDLLCDPGDMGERGRETVLAACRLEHVVDLYERLFSCVRGLPPGVLTPEQLQCLPWNSGSEVAPCVESAG